MTVLGVIVFNFSSHSSCLMFVYRHFLSNYCYCHTVFLSVFLALFLSSSSAVPGVSLSSIFHGINCCSLP